MQFSNIIEYFTQFYHQLNIDSLLEMVRDMIISHEFVSVYSMLFHFMFLQNIHSSLYIIFEIIGNLSPRHRWRDNIAKVLRVMGI